MCERTCKFDAIHVVDNVAVIDYTKCKNCTMCAKACPRNAIEPIGGGGKPHGKRRSWCTFRGQWQQENRKR